MALEERRIPYQYREVNVSERTASAPPPNFSSSFLPSSSAQDPILALTRVLPYL
jgi:hypothetical protein